MEWSCSSRLTTHDSLFKFAAKNGFESHIFKFEVPSPFHHEEGYPEEGHGETDGHAETDDHAVEDEHAPESDGHEEPTSSDH